MLKIKNVLINVGIASDKGYSEWWTDEKKIQLQYPIQDHPWLFQLMAPGVNLHYWMFDWVGSAGSAWSVASQKYIAKTSKKAEWIMWGVAIIWYAISWHAVQSSTSLN